MPKLHYSIKINAPKEKVWNTMLEDTTYRLWTIAFCPGSYYEGSWDKDSIIKFFGTDIDGNINGGMYSRIKENINLEFISIEHLGMIDANGVIDTESDEVKKWAPSYENYTFKEVDGVTEVLIDLDTNEEWKDIFDESWPKALDILKEISEKQI